MRCGTCSFENEAGARFCSSCGSLISRGGDSEAQSDPLIGTRVAGRYIVRKVLGRGGMGTVYLAEQTFGTSLRKVALKVLTTGRDDERARARFLRECDAVVRLSHPHTIRFYDVGTLDDGRLYIAMEFVEGQSLAHALESGPLPISIATELIEQIGGSLTEAHKAGIIHRDLKPDNVLLSPKEGGGYFAKVCDFGIAKVRDVTHDSDQGSPPQNAIAHNITGDGHIVGTPAYMSPEQFEGKKLDPRSDLYSFGIMSFEMLTGERPLHARTPFEWASVHLTGDPKSLSDYPELKLSHRYAELLDRTLAKDPDARPESVRAFVESFRQITADLANDSRRTSLPTGDEPTAKESPWFAWTSAAAVLLVIIGGWALAKAWPKPSGESDPLTTQTPNDASVETAPEPPAEFVWLNVVHYQDQVENPAGSLGPPDGVCAIIAPQGKIVLELGSRYRLRRDHTDAPEIRVEVDAARSGAYRLDVAEVRGTFVTAASDVVGSMELDVDGYDEPIPETIRFLRIKNRSSRPVCLDAIGVVSRS